MFIKLTKYELDKKYKNNKEYKEIKMQVETFV